MLSTFIRPNDFAHQLNPSFSPSSSLSNNDNALPPVFHVIPMFDFNTESVDANYNFYRHLCFIILYIDTSHRTARNIEGTFLKFQKKHLINICMQQFLLHSVVNNAEFVGLALTAYATT